MCLSLSSIFLTGVREPIVLEGFLPRLEGGGALGQCALRRRRRRHAQLRSGGAGEGGEPMKESHLAMRSEKIDPIQHASGLIL